jgi:hypothetical protein
VTKGAEGGAGPAAHVAWAKGGEAELVAIDGDRVRLRSTISSAPGSPLEGALAATGKPIRLKLKVARCRRVEGGEFEIEGRLLDATREVRAELSALLQSSARAGPEG